MSLLRCGQPCRYAVEPAQIPKRFPGTLRGQLNRTTKRAGLDIPAARNRPVKPVEPLKDSRRDRNQSLKGLPLVNPEYLILRWGPNDSITVAVQHPASRLKIEHNTRIERFPLRCCSSLRQVRIMKPLNTQCPKRWVIPKPVHESRCNNISVLACHI